MINSVLLNSPKEYAKSAISIIEIQLKTAQSPARIAKLNHRLKQWKKALELLSEYDESKEKTKTDSCDSRD
ncbi:hypothetical protein UFOVP410_38 [uncultured Caudovirales phage]|uniref:Uncharacterized protein n=1 Tax=uncultured Caudovirales phage TaxID=2100421 RepID=A0A6J5MBW0_9CAUD|nr:hypothetical protein UFOVP410_38 [uncultured Caudovirales phage]